MSGATTALLDGTWRDWDPTMKRALLSQLQASRSTIVRDRWRPYPWQRSHVHPDGWTGADGGPWCGPECLDLPVYRPKAHETYMLLGGRGTGKTDAGTQHVLDHVYGPACDPRVPGGHRVAIVAPTIGDAIEACVSGPSGLRTYDTRVQVRDGRNDGGTTVAFPNGARARVMGAHTPDDVSRLRAAGNVCLVWLEEAAAQRRLADVLEISAFGLRLGQVPHYVVTTTPRSRPEVRALMESPKTILTRGRLKDAWHLPVETRIALEEKYAGTRIGRQEMDGELLTDTDGALWRQWMIDNYRRPANPLPGFSRVVVGVDPNAGGPDECGIVVVGIARDKEPDKSGYSVQHLYVLDDVSGRFDNPGEWARAAVDAYTRWRASGIVAEINNGGDMVAHTLRMVDASVPVRSVTATRGKARRAEPIVAAYEQGRVHHAGALPRLEDQMTTWTELSTGSPDRMDALVWAATDAMVSRDSARGMFAAV